MTRHAKPSVGVSVELIITFTCNRSRTYETRVVLAGQAFVFAVADTRQAGRVTIRIDAVRFVGVR
jgi:hypothetical protein